MVPPLVGVAVNVAPAPAHIGFVPEVSAIVTNGETEAFTLIVIALEVAGLPETQLVLLVITHVIWSRLFNPLSAYDALLVPTFTLFFFHW